MSEIKVLYVSQEITPYLPETEISTICRNLPQAIQEKGREIRTFMPRFGCINERRNQLHEVIRLSGMNLIIDDTDHPLIIKVASIQAARMQIYFIDNEEYFQRRQIVKDDQGNDFEDNEDRTIFFVRGVLETVKKLRWTPDIIHCNGWFTSVLPIYIKKVFNDEPFFANSKIVFSSYDNAFKTPFSNRFAEKLKLGNIVDDDLKTLIGNTVDHTTLTKFALDYSDALIQGSSTIDPSIVEHARKLNIPVLGFQGPDTYVDAYNDLYEQVYNKK